MCGLAIYRIPVQHGIHQLLNQFPTLIHLKIGDPRKLTLRMNGSVFGMIGGLLDELHLGSGSHCRSRFQIKLDVSFLSLSLPASFPQSSRFIHEKHLSKHLSTLVSGSWGCGENKETRCIAWLDPWKLAYNTADVDLFTSSDRTTSRKPSI